MKSLSLRKPTTPDQTPEPVGTPDLEPLADPIPSTAPVDPQESPAAEAAQPEPDDTQQQPSALNEIVPWLHRNRVLVYMAIGFLLFWNLADWTTTTGAHMRGQYTYSDEMAQLWTASYRMLFIVGVAWGLISFAAPGLIRYWRRDAESGINAFEDFMYHIPPHQRLWLSLALLFVLCYLFILLLGVKLPESSSVGL